MKDAKHMPADRPVDRHPAKRAKTRGRPRNPEHPTKDQHPTRRRRPRDSDQG